MRTFFREGDLISAEVQNVGMQDGKITLQTRQKNGKLYNGFLFKVDPNFIRRQKIHIHDLSDLVPGISLIIGTNGYLFVQPADQLAVLPLLQTVKPVSADLRENMSFVRNVVVALEKARVPIFRETIARAIESSRRLGVKQRDILKNVEQVTKEAREMIQKEINLLRPQANMLTLDT